MTSMQGISGAGRSPGVVALDILDNVIPFIPGEEEKVARETRKILGVRSARARSRRPRSSCRATCTRAAVLEGHTEAVSVSLATPCSPEDAASAIASSGASSASPACRRRRVASSPCTTIRSARSRASIAMPMAA